MKNGRDGRTRTCFTPASKAGSSSPSPSSRLVPMLGTAPRSSAYRADALLLSYTGIGWPAWTRTMNSGLTIRRDPLSLQAIIGVVGFAPTSPLGHRFYRPAQLSDSGAHLLKWLRGPESNRRERAYETLQRSQHSPRYEKFGGGNGTCTRHTLCARQHRHCGHAPPLKLLQFSGTNTVTTPFGDVAAGISRRTFRCFRHTSHQADSVPRIRRYICL